MAEELLWVELALVSEMVFGLAKIDSNADLKAFAHGMTCALAPGSLPQVRLKLVRRRVMRD